MSKSLFCLMGAHYEQKLIILHDGLYIFRCIMRLKCWPLKCVIKRSIKDKISKEPRFLHGKSIFRAQNDHRFSIDELTCRKPHYFQKIRQILSRTHWRCLKGLKIHLFSIWSKKWAKNDHFVTGNHVKKDLNSYWHVNTEIYWSISNKILYQCTK